MALTVETPITELVDVEEETSTPAEELEATDVVEEISAYEFMLVQSDIY